MENYDAHWPEFMKGLTRAEIVDNYEKLDKIAKQYDKELAELYKEKARQDLNFSRARINKRWDFDTPKKVLDASTIAKSNAVLETYRRKEAFNENERDLTKPSPKEANQEKKQNGTEPDRDGLKRKDEIAAKFKEQKDDIEKDLDKRITEEKFAQAQENADDITKSEKQDEPDNQEKKELDAEREKFKEEMRAAREREKSKDRER